MKTMEKDNQFIAYLHSLVQRLSCSKQNQLSKVVEWDPKDNGFIVNNQETFTNQILMTKLTISRFDSFVRKLNKYGFRRSKFDKTKFRFFHKDFTRDGKFIHRIKKLSKEEFLPKHIKLRKIREQINKNIEQNKDQNINKIEENQKNGCQKNNVFRSEQNLRITKFHTQIESKEDIGIYLIKDKQTRF